MTPENDPYRKVMAPPAVIRKTVPLPVTPPLLVMPFTWGAVTGLGLTAWAYEPKRVRKVGEVVVMMLVLFYLVVGVLAGENLRLWLNLLPEDAKEAIGHGVRAKRSKSGAVSFDVLGTEASHAPLQ